MSVPHLIGARLSSAKVYVNFGNSDSREFRIRAPLDARARLALFYAEEKRDSLSSNLDCAQNGGVYGTTEN
jgi:hypothetical protein